jgi:hypothetical protein
MLKFSLVEETPKKVVYKYFPEGGSDAGVVSFDKESKTNSIVSLSAKDRHQRYAQKLFGHIREFAEINSFAKEGMIAWY